MTKLRVLTIAGIIAILIISSGCLIGFMKDPNDITEWVNPLEDGTELSYYTIVYRDGVTVETVSSTATVFGVNEDDEYYAAYLIDSRGFDYYLTIDYEDNRFLEGSQEGPGYYDIVLLDTPIEVGTSWYEYNGSDRIFEITEIGVTKTVDAGTFYDVIVVESEYSDAGGDYYTYYYISQGSGVILYYMSQVTDVSGEIISTHRELTNID